jgi:hypothetical protein
MAIGVLKNRPFARWAKGEQPTDKALCAAVREIQNGLVEARLGGFLFKKRIAKDHKGKSGGLRTILAYRQEDRLVFLFGFAKRERSSIDATERKALLELGAIYMAMSEKELAEGVKEGKLIEVHCDDQDENEEPNSQ